MFRRSREGAWIEMSDVDIYSLQARGRSREGAWIEIRRVFERLCKDIVAPVRERGLKLRKLKLVVLK